MNIFHKYKHSSLPTSLIKLKKNNRSRNYMWHFLFCAILNLGKRIQTAKITKKWSFHNFEHSSLTISLIKQNKNNWARNYMWRSYHFVQLWHKPFLNLPKNLGKRTQTVKTTKKWSFFITLNTPPWQLRS